MRGFVWRAPLLKLRAGERVLLGITQYLQCRLKRVDSAARLYLEELLSDYSRQWVMEKLRVQSYGTFRSNFDKGVNLRCIQLLKDGFNV